MSPSPGIHHLTDGISQSSTFPIHDFIYENTGQRISASEAMDGQQTSFNGRYNDLTGMWVMIAGIAIAALGGALRERKLPAVGSLGAAGAGVLAAFFAFLSIGKINDISDQAFGPAPAGLEGVEVALSPAFGLYVAIGLGILTAALGAYAYQQRTVQDEQATGAADLQTPSS